MQMHKRAARIIRQENNTHVDFVKEPFNENNGFPFLLRRAYINRCSIAYKGLKETTPKDISSILKNNTERGRTFVRYKNNKKLGWTVRCWPKEK